MSYLYNNINWYSMSDAAIITELGKQLKRMRIRANITQQELAAKSGIFRSTISEIENGRVSNMLSFVQILRGLEQLDVLGAFVVPDSISPLMVAEQQAKYRKRATGSRKTKPASEW
ncbi:helix-turn-helix domain-containing protein [Lacihabitans soyangensis]|uniref:XRE family transcriptional regulator n=1 Tax=Lacihabitans soyangensis TaxID=869394 RepID=A0AAE3H2L0_9BACT|nr:transcriptional regulator [Lacihabitans soyangensis]MCP9762881.1 XRE family transcriptional regulator [Lacihabitans soyangensis]